VNKFSVSEYKQWEKTMESLQYKQPIMCTEKTVLSPSQWDCILFSKTREDPKRIVALYK